MSEKRAKRLRKQHAKEAVVQNRLTPTAQAVKVLIAQLRREARRVGK